MTYCRFSFAQGDTGTQCSLKSGSYRIDCYGNNDETTCQTAITMIKAIEQEIKEWKNYAEKHRKIHGE